MNQDARGACVAVMLSFCSVQFFSQTISSHYFGQNAWMPDTIGSNPCLDPPCVFNGKLDQYWHAVKDSKALLVRFGGTSADKNMPTHYQYIHIIDSIRSNGMEPILQVPFYKYRYTSQQAAAIVQYVNIAQGKHVKYWSIGNEPDLSYSYSASQIATYFRDFASAMKAADPSILIVGPDLAWFNQPIVDALTTPNGPSDITGKDISGRYYLDVFAFHRYPFNGSQTRQQVIANLTAPGGLQDNLVYLNGRILGCNTAHNRTGSSAISTALTEGNICWQNSAADNLQGTGANSFLGGQFLAEMMAIGLKNNLDFFNVWSVAEGNGGIVYNIGYINPDNGMKKPLYHHFKLMAENFKGNYADGTSNQLNVKAFGSKSAQQICVLILNEDLTTGYNYTVRLNNSAIGGTNPLKINVNAGLAADYNDMIPAQSSVLLTFNAAGTITRKCEYEMNVQAVANQPPGCTNFTTTSSGSSPAAEDGAVFGLKNIFPNPTAGKITIELDRGKMRQPEYEVQLYNIIGQQVFSRRFTFEKNREEIELPPSVADGVYVVRVKEGEKDNFVTRKIILQR